MTKGGKTFLEKKDLVLHIADNIGRLERHINSIQKNKSTVTISIDRFSASFSVNLEAFFKREIERLETDLKLLFPDE